MIPKIIHTIWVSAGPHDPLPLYAEKNFQLMKDLHPTWDVRMTTAIPKMPSDIMRKALDAPLPEQMSDIIRYWLMYSIGGFYVDLDMVMVKSLDGLRDMSPFIGQVHGKRLEIACIGSKPGDQGWLEVLKACVTWDLNTKNRMCYGPSLMKQNLSCHFNLLETEYFYFPEKPLLKFYKADEAGRKEWLEEHTSRVEPYGVHVYLVKPEDG